MLFLLHPLPNIHSPGMVGRFQSAVCWGRVESLCAEKEKKKGLESGICPEPEHCGCAEGAG